MEQRCAECAAGKAFDRIPTSSSARPMLNYNEDKMPSQLKQNKPSDVSKTLCIWKKEKEITGD